MPQCQELKIMQNGSVPHSNQDCINPGEEDEMEVHGYRWNPGKAAVTWLCIILTVGFLRLVFHWCPQWMLYFTHSRCKLDDAQKLLFVDNFQGKYVTYHIKDIKTLSTCIDSDQKSTIGNLASNKYQTVRIHLSNDTYKDVDGIRAVWVKKLCYVWDEGQHSFFKLCGLDKGLTKNDFHSYTGYSSTQQDLRRIVYGLNEIAVPMQSILTLLFLEVINPFYIFQVFTLVVWMCEQYYYYTGAIIIMSVFGVTSSIVQTRRNQRSLHNTVRSSDMVTVCHEDGTKDTVPSSYLVPGDVIVIPPQGCAMQCDAILLNGSCIVNESMLTGESVPVTKTSLSYGQQSSYDDKEDANHTLFCGTKVIQTRYYGEEDVKALVLRTGYLTAKGSLVRSILYPPPADFKFDRDTYKFIGILAIIATLGFLYTIILKVLRSQPASDVAIKALDIITIVVPPALPATMTMGKLYGQQRLKAAKIYCINSRVINVSGSLDCVCFDKTGTLTEDGLDMWGVVPVASDAFQTPVKATSDLKRDKLLEGMACCHSITVINEELMGDPLDVKMFEFTGWELNESSAADFSKFDTLVPTVVKPPHSQDPGSEDSSELAIIHQYQFSSTLQRMSVIVMPWDSRRFVAFCKGSPEMIVALSKPETVPANLAATLQQYTVEGYRVIAMGWRQLEDMDFLRIQRLAREDVEQDLTFAGLIILENRLKPETKSIIRELQQANIRTIMITGDNIQTAISVARECGIVMPGQRVVDTTAVLDASPRVFFTETEASPAANAYENSGLGVVNNSFMLDDGEDGLMKNGRGNPSYTFALTGRTWGIIRDNIPELLPKIVARGAVFARMSSVQKQELILELKELGYYVAMCGDGANDCGALKAAHAGISLSEAEASVASPFTSKEANISCVPKVIREGRAALVTAFGIFKFMVAYSLTEFLSTAILYYIDSNLTDFEFLFIDILLVVHFALFFGKTEAYAGRLVSQPPTTNLYSLPPMASIVFQMLIVIVIQITSFSVVKLFPWYTPHHREESYASYENYAVFTVSMFQYIAMAIVFSNGSSYRKSIFTNYILIFSLLLMTIICTYITVYPDQNVISILELQVPPAYNFRIIVLCLGVVHFFFSLFFEAFVVEFILFKKLRYRWHDINKSRRKFLKIEEELRMNVGWPPLTLEHPIVASQSATQLLPRPMEQIPREVARVTYST